MEKVCKNCGATEFAKFEGGWECLYCGEYYSDTDFGALVTPAEPAIVTPVEPVVAAVKEPAFAEAEVFVAQDEMGFAVDNEEETESEFETPEATGEDNADGFENEESAEEETDGQADDEDADEDATDDDITDGEVGDQMDDEEDSGEVINQTADDEAVDGETANETEDEEDSDEEAGEKSVSDAENERTIIRKVDNMDWIEESVYALGPASEKKALEFFMYRSLADGFKVMDELSETDKGPYDNLIYYYIAKCCERGEGTQVDFDHAKHFYSLAENNPPKGERSELGLVYYNLAMMYLKGDFFCQSEEKAFQLFQKSAKYGHVKGMYNLGLCYKLGKGTAKDEYKAFDAFYEAAEYGDSMAYFQVGKAYENGAGVAKDLNMAVRWHKKAANAKETCAMCALGDIYYYDKQGELRMDMENGADRLQTAFAWYSKGAGLGDANCLYNLGQCYDKGIGCKRDVYKAMEMMERAFRNGNAQAEERLAEMRGQSRPTEIRKGEYYN